MPHRRRNRRPGENRRPQRLAEEPVDRIDLPGGARTALYVFSATAPGATPAAVDEAETRPGQEQQSAQTSVAMIVPALGVSAGSYLRFARALSDRGRHVLLADLRGVGNSTVRAGRHCDWGYLDLIDGELHSLWEKADTHFPGAEKLWVGHSLGGHLALMHQARHADQPVKRIELVASGSPWYPNYPGVYGWVTRALGRFAELSSRGLGAFPGHWIGFGGKQGARLMREWAGFVEHGLPGPLADASWDLAAALKQVTTPIRAVCMAADTYCPPAATEHLVELSGSVSSIEHLRHVDGGRAPGHFVWMRHPHPVARLLCRDT